MICIHSWVHNIQCFLFVSLTLCEHKNVMDAIALQVLLCCRTPFVGGSYCIGSQNYASQGHTLDSTPRCRTSMVLSSLYTSFGSYWCLYNNRGEVVLPLIKPSPLYCRELLSFRRHISLSLHGQEEALTESSNSLSEHSRDPWISCKTTPAGGWRVNTHSASALATALWLSGDPLW